MPRWIKVLIAAVLTIGVLGGLAEWGLRLVVPGVLENQLRDNLELPRSQPVVVTLGGSALLYAVQGSIGDVTVEMVDAPVADGVRATLELHADRVPFSATSKEMRNATASIFVAGDELGPVVSLLTNGVADSGQTENGSITVGRTVETFGFQVPLKATLGLSVEDGEVRVEPRGLSAVGFDLSAEQIAAATGGLLDPLLSAHVICVADRMPAGIDLESIRVSMGGVRVDVDLAPDFLSNPKQQQLGSCN